MQLKDKQQLLRMAQALQSGSFNKVLLSEDKLIGLALASEACSQWAPRISSAQKRSNETIEPKQQGS